MDELGERRDIYMAATAPMGMGHPHLNQSLSSLSLVRLLFSVPIPVLLFDLALLYPTLTVIFTPQSWQAPPP